VIVVTVHQRRYALTKSEELVFCPELLLLNLALQMKRAGDTCQPGVIPAKAGIQAFTGVSWTPACAGVTSPGTHHRLIRLSNTNKK